MRARGRGLGVGADGGEVKVGWYVPQVSLGWQTLGRFCLIYQRE